MKEWDTMACIRISHWNGRRSIDRMMYLASHFGYGYSYPVIGIIVMALDYANTQLIFHIGIVSFLIEHMIYRIVKRWTKRIRPFKVIPEIKNRMKIPDEFSFPSGHAAGAFLMATLLRHFYPAFTIPLYMFAYNGVHYPSDVMAGSFLGIFSARIGIALFV
jgi:undecaprenyl-diphosphatase